MEQEQEYKVSARDEVNDGGEGVKLKAKAKRKTNIKKINDRTFC